MYLAFIFKLIYMKTFSFLVVVLLIFNTNIIYSQKQANFWYFGSETVNINAPGIGLNFSNEPPLVLNECVIPFFESSAVISDSSGNLLFYSNGTVVINALQDTMPNGFNIIGDMSSSNGSIIIKKPKSNNLYYLFTTYMNSNLYYSIIDMNLNYGNGDVIQKNILLCDSITERLAATYHENSVDIWLCTHERDNDKFVSFLITENGIDTIPIKSIIGNNYNASWNTRAGQMKFSPNGNKLAIAPQSLNVEVFHFNKSTGVVYDQILKTTITSFYGVEFSPSDSYLYISNETIYQYDLNAGNDSLINNSKILITDYNTRGLQLAPNGKIYVARSGGYISVINYPDSVGLSCNYDYDGIYLYGKTSKLSFPNFISNYFDFNTGVKTPSINDENYEMYPNPASSRITIASKQLSVNGNKLLLYDLFGKEVLATEIKEQTIDISLVTQGVYVYKIIDNKGIMKSGKLVIMR